MSSQSARMGCSARLVMQVIVYDPSWNPTTDNQVWCCWSILVLDVCCDGQAVDRAYRVGQNKVRHLVTRFGIADFVCRMLSCIDW